MGSCHFEENRKIKERGDRNNERNGDAIVKPIEGMR